TPRRSRASHGWNSGRVSNRKPPATSSTWKAEPPASYSERSRRTSRRASAAAARPATAARRRGGRGPPPPDTGPPAPPPRGRPAARQPGVAAPCRLRRDHLGRGVEVETEEQTGAAVGGTVGAAGAAEGPPGQRVSGHRAPPWCAASRGCAPPDGGIRGCTP